MKATHTTLTNAPEILFSEGTFIINGKTYSQSILFSPKWEMSTLDIKTPEEWIEHPKRLNCTQLLTWEGATPTPQILDLYWQQNIQVDIMAVSPAIQTAKILIGDQIDFQLVLFNTP